MHVKNTSRTGITQLHKFDELIEQSVPHPQQPGDRLRKINESTARARLMAT